MATIKALEGRTVHQIQSGQVIVDLCSVVKELVENSLDAGATSIDVRFKNNGLEAIEVQDNGIGISRENYETIALKHYTSKLSNYDDLTSLKTFGFRGEALSSLCALSTFHLATAQAEEAPKGTRLDFETSGRLKGTQVVACQKGTTVAVENLFMNLPVRRRELEKNIKREYGKVLGVLQAYACISTEARISVSNVMAKSKKAIVFATKSNQNTRDNIANVFGAKALTGLVAMDLKCEMQPSKTRIQGWRTQMDTENKQVRVVGHVSRPILGGGRQAPDRQMFFVNSRPCSLPQVAKVFNEVYKSFNISQSPFVFANIVLDTNAYDVNVSPDKRTILLHDQNTLLETLKTSLTELFDKQEQTVPQIQPPIPNLPSSKQLPLRQEASIVDESGDHDISHEVKSSEGAPTITAEEGEQEESADSDSEPQNERATSLIAKFAGRNSRGPVRKTFVTETAREDRNAPSKYNRKLVEKLGKGKDSLQQTDDPDDAQTSFESNVLPKDRPVLDFNLRIAELQAATPSKQQQSSQSEDEDEIAASQPSPVKSTPGVVQNAFNRMRPRRDSVEVATITIGSKTTTSPLRPSYTKKQKIEHTPVDSANARSSLKSLSTQKFSSSMKVFAAPGTKPTVSDSMQRDELDQEEEANLSSSEPAVDDPVEEIDSEEGRSEQYEAEDPSLEDPEAECDEPGSKLQADLEAQDSDSDYLDEEGKKAKEDARVAELIQLAEEQSAAPSENNVKRAIHLLKGGGQKDSTTDLVQVIQTTVERIDAQLRSLERAMLEASQESYKEEPVTRLEDESPEDRLSLTVSKEDFSHMRIIGQFNLGFILAVRPSQTPIKPNSTPSTLAKRASSADQLFIIDQHASDEKSTFERLQSTTVVQNQRLVNPKPLDLTAIEEEIILENNTALLRNGFVVAMDTTGASPVGRRCKLLSLPMSKDVTFSVSDLEELIALLADSPPLLGSTATDLSQIPHPSKIRRLFAMRACRSSVMIGKPLSKIQMRRLVTRMGEVDKPWNCPHGRPTMRHVLGLGGWEGWREGDGVVGLGDEMGKSGVDWKGFVERMGRGDDDKLEDDSEHEEASSDEEDPDQADNEGEHPTRNI